MSDQNPREQAEQGGQAQETADRPPVDPAQLESDIVAALQNVYDPEIPVNIYDLGLIYKLEVSPEGDVYIEMTLTAPGCPVAQTFPDMVASHVRAVPGVRDVRVELVWDPPWTKDRMSESARLQLGFF